MKCDELKAMSAVDAYEEYENNILDESRSYDVYNKQDVDEAIAELKKQLRKQKRKRCIAMARDCHLMLSVLLFPSKEYFRKWAERGNKWIDLADKFKG